MKLVRTPMALDSDCKTFRFSAGAKWRAATLGKQEPNFQQTSISAKLTDLSLVRAHFFILSMDSLRL